MRERRQSLVLAGVVVAALALHASSLFAGPTWDDHKTVQGHVGAGGPFSLAAIFGRDFWGHPLGSADAIGTYRPLVTLTYWIDIHLGRSWGWMHATNLLWFGLLLVLVDRWLRRFAPLSAPVRLAAVAAFSVLAIHTDAIPSVTGRAEIMAAVFVVAALELVLVERVWAILACSLALGAAMLCKESALPMALAVLWVGARRAPGRARMAALAGACLAPLVAVALFRAGRLPFRVDAFAFRTSNPLLVASPLRRIAGSGEALVRYLEHTLVPVDLCPDYGYASLVPQIGLRAAIGLLLILGIVAIALAAMRRSPRLADALVLAMASYVTVSHILVASSAFVADRNFFLPSLFLCVAIAIPIDAALGTRERLARPALWIASAFVAVQAFLTLLAVPDWRDDLTLSAHAIEACPTGMRMLVFRGEILHRAAPEESAWFYLAAGAIYDRFPETIDESTLPSEWSALPVEQRVARLRGSLGRERFVRACASAIAALGKSGFADSIVMVDRWSRLAP